MLQEQQAQACLGALLLEGPLRHQDLVQRVSRALA
jgi:hypothetical protein